MSVYSRRHSQLSRIPSTPSRSVICPWSNHSRLKSSPSPCPTVLRATHLPPVYSPPTPKPKIFLALSPICRPAMGFRACRWQGSPHQLRPDPLHPPSSTTLRSCPHHRCPHFTTEAFPPNIRRARLQPCRLATGSAPTFLVRLLQLRALSLSHA